MNITSPQPSGNICKDCHETIRRGWPGTPRSETVARLDNLEFKNGPFAEARKVYQEDVRDRIKFGTSKVKKRVKAIKKTEKTKVKQTLKGTMVRVAKYREAGSVSLCQNFCLD